MEDWDGLAKAMGYGNEEGMLRSLYIDEELGLKECAKRVHCGQATFASRLIKHNIPRRPAGGANNTCRVSKLLFRMDQRLLFNLSDLQISQITGAHWSSVYKYKKGVTSIWNSAPSPPLQDCSNTEQP